MNILILKGKRRIFVQRCLDVGVAANSIDQPTLPQLRTTSPVTITIILMIIIIRSKPPERR